MPKSSVSYRSVGDQVPMRIRLLKVASELFAKKGYYGTSLMDIARQCGVQKSTVFHHFSSKQSLALETIKNMHIYCETHVFQCLQKVQPISPEQKAINFVRAIQKFIQERPDAFLLNFLAMELVEVSSHSAFEQPIKTYFLAWSNALLEVLRPMHDEAIAKKLATHSLVYIQGIQIMARVSRDQACIRQMPHYLLELWKLS